MMMSITFGSYGLNSIFENILLSILRICLIIIPKSFRTFKLEPKLLSLTVLNKILFDIQIRNLIFSAYRIKYCVN